MKITAIHQPSFFPWLGLLDKIAKSNHFVFLDHVSVNKGSYQYRNLFYCNGLAKFLTLPVNISINKPFNELIFTNNQWEDEHLEKLRNYYRRAHYFQQIFPIIETFYNENKRNTPVDLIINSMNLMFSLYDIKVETELSSKLSCANKKGHMVLEICQKNHTDIYLSGRGAKGYLDDEVLRAFSTSGIGLIWHDFKHPVYNQMNQFAFVNGLSSLDLIFFHGEEKSREIFWNNVNASKTDE